MLTFDCWKFLFLLIIQTNIEFLIFQEKCNKIKNGCIYL